MDESAAVPGSLAQVAALEQQMDTLQTENRALREQLSANTVQLAQEQAQAHQIRMANQHLVLATFGARDSTTAAEAVNQRQTVFLSMLAHELRNPMAAISIANSVMESLHLAHPRAAKLLAIVRRQSGHLVRLVDDLLDASRITTGKISLQSGALRLSDVIDSAIETAQPVLAARSQSLQINLPPSIVLRGDHVRLSQLFANLLTNASKFSAPGTVVAIAAVVLADALEVTVSDTGKGIAAEHQSEIFGLFVQGPESGGQSPGGGLGIGLTLVRTIAEMHGGSVRVVSAGAGCGSAFIVRLPLTVRAGHHAPIELPEGEPSLHRN